MSVDEIRSPIRSMRQPIFAVLVGLATFVVACGRDQTRTSPVNDGGSEPSLVASARAAAGCRWLEREPPEDAFLDPDCPALKVWNEKFGTATAKLYESELIDLLPAPERGVRWVAARGLTLVSQPQWRRDDTLARRVLARATAETDPAVGHLVGELVGSIWIADDSLSTPQFAEPVLAALRNGARPSVRAGVARKVLASNPKVPAVKAGLVDLARAPGPALPRMAALDALAYQSTKDSSVDEPTCSLLLDASRDPDARVSANAATLIAGNNALGGCPAKREALLTGLAEYPALTPIHVAALGRVAEVATSALQKQAVAILRRIVETKDADSDLRKAALSTIGERDPDAKTFASRFLYDDDVLLRLDAASILGVDVPIGSPKDAGADASAKTARPDGGARAK